MSKLVDDPYEVEPFTPLLLPALQRAKEEVSDPECRDVCQAAFDQLTRTASQPPIWKKCEVATVVQTLTQICGGGDASVLAFAGGLAHMLMDMKNLKADAWQASLGPYLKQIGKGSAEASPEEFDNPFHTLPPPAPLRLPTPAPMC